MTSPGFIAKWRQVELRERSAAQEHFLELCRVFGHPTPAAADPTGEKYCFEKGAAKHEGGTVMLAPCCGMDGNVGERNRVTPASKLVGPTAAAE